MATANYRIDLSNRAGRFASHNFTGTRRRARAEARRLSAENDDSGYQIHFINYVDDKKGDTHETENR